MQASRLHYETQGGMMFAALFFDRGDPLRFQDLPHALVTSVQVWGSIAAVALLFWLIFGLPRLPASERKRIPPWKARCFAFFTGLSFLSYFVLALTCIPMLLAALSPEEAEAGYLPSSRLRAIQVNLLTLASLLALAAILLPFVANLLTLSGRRIWAIARLSFQEALRRRVLYVFAALLLVFLFANWYDTSKPEDQIRRNVATITFPLMWVLVVASIVILAAWSIPTDIKQQTIHTILTKPVQRLEVVLGRFLGFVGLLTLILIVITTFSLVFVLRNINAEAAEESLKSRTPLYGELSFENTADRKKADSVGREWGYRSYISGPMPGKVPPEAIWSFPQVPAGLANRPWVPCEFTFDIYRTHKGFENRGVACDFFFQTRNFKKGSEEQYRKCLKEELDRPSRTKTELDIANELSEEFGYYEKRAKDLSDFHTLTIDVPGGVFRNALKETAPAESRGSDREAVPALQVRVKCISNTQYVGMAKYDLYFRLDDPEGKNDRLWFAWNFYKGACGLWFDMVLVAGLATAFSTYFSGVISLLLASLFFIAGMFQEFIKTVGEGTNVGGGPLEALFRLASRQHLTAPLENSTVAQVAAGSDVVYRWFIRLLLEILPDVNRFSLTNYVAEGFNVPVEQLGVKLVLLAGYLVPWLVLSYYLMKWREIAGPT